MPFVHTAYATIYAGLFGSLEERLNRALHGRPATDQQLPAQEGDGQAAAEGGDAPPAQRPAGLGHYWVSLLILTRALHLLFQDDIPRERGAPGDDNAAQGGGEIHGGEDGEAAADGGELVNGIPVGPQIPRMGDIPNEEDAREPQHAPEPEPQQQGQNQLAAAAEPARQQQQRNQDARRRQPAEDLGITPFHSVTNGLATTLLFPAISYGIGEIIRYVTPRSWSRRPSFRKPATGLLQYRWGRSLMGGFLFFVLRDAFALFYTYRRVQVKQARKVRNVDKAAARNGGRQGGATS